MRSLNDLIADESLGNLLKNRQVLEPKFLTGEIPEEADFFGLIHNMISRKEDGIFKNSSQPLWIQSGTDVDKSVLLFYDDPASPPRWKISTNNGLRIGSVDNETELIIREAGDLGIDIKKPKGKLHILYKGESTHGIGLLIDQDQTVANLGPKIQFRKSFLGGWANWLIGFNDGNIEVDGNFQNAQGRDFVIAKGNFQSGIDKVNFVVSHEDNIGINTNKPKAQLHLGGYFNTIQMGDNLDEYHNFHWVNEVWNNEEAMQGRSLNLYHKNLGRGDLLMRFGIMKDKDENENKTLYLNSHLRLSDKNNAGVIYFPSSGKAPNFYLRSGSPTLFNERLYISGINGFLGIGTSNPSAQFTLGSDDDYTSFQMGSNSNVKDRNFHWVNESTGNENLRSLNLYNGILGSGKHLFSIHKSGNIKVYGGLNTYKLSVVHNQGLALSEENPSSDQVVNIESKIVDNSKKNKHKYGIHSIATGNNGNKYGVYGKASGTADFDQRRFGVFGEADAGQSDDTSATYGVYGKAKGKGGTKFGVGGYVDSKNGVKYGVMGSSVGKSGTNIGIGGYAFHGDVNWAGFFHGNVIVAGNTLLTQVNDNDSDKRISDRLYVRGTAHSEGGWSTPRRDFSELFESLDGNEIQLGTSVIVAKNGKIRAAKVGEVPIGVVTNNTAFIGNSYREWPGKYEKDEFGNIKLEEIEIKNSEKYLIGLEEGSNSEIKGKSQKVIRPKISPDYDKTQTYVQRENRPEWNIVGILGQLRLKKGQPTAPGWIKLKDISDNVELWFVK